MGDKLSALLCDLANQLLAAKNAEAQARAARIAVEEQIIAKVVFPGDSGQKTITLDDGTKIIIKKSLSYKVDFKALEKLDLRDQYGEVKPLPIKYKTAASLDTVGYEWYRENDSAMFAVLSEHVAVSSLKPSVEVKR